MFFVFDVFVIILYLLKFLSLLILKIVRLGMVVIFGFLWYFFKGSNFVNCVCV